MKDLDDASTPGRYASITDVRGGADDGTVSFAFMSDSLPMGVAMMEALVPGK